jgi:hypothetical protein
MEKKLEELKKPLPKEAIKQHPTKTYLSSIKAIYVTERFNEVFGVGKWSVKVEKEYADYTTGMVVVKVIFEVKELGIYYESFGGNDNGGIDNKNFDLGDAYKGASTDGITKIGSYLGVGIDVFKGLGNKTEQPKQSTPTTDLYVFKADDMALWNGKIYAGNSIFLNNEKKVISKEQIEKLKASPKFKPETK